MNCVWRFFLIVASSWASSMSLVQFARGMALRPLSGGSAESLAVAEPIISWLARPGAMDSNTLRVSGFASAPDSAQVGTQISPRQMRALLGSSLTDAGLGGGSLLSSSVKMSKDISPSSVLELRSLYASEYVGIIGIGTQPSGESEAYLNVIFDTGSADLWVASDLCALQPCTETGRSRFNHSRSTTFRSPASAVQLATIYETGELHGQRGFDDVRVGTLLARDQPLGLISQERGYTFQHLPVDGIVGLAFSKLAAGGSETLFDGLLRDGSMARHEFAFYLHPDPRRGGAILWGGATPHLRNAETMRFPVVREVYWALDLIGFRVGDYALEPAVVNGSGENSSINERSVESPGQARGSPRDVRLWPELIVDSGTTFFTADEQTSRAVAAAAAVPPGACTSVDHLPPLVFTIRDARGDSRDVVVPPEEYMVRSDFYKNSCSPGFVHMQMPPGVRPIMILGEVFMRHYFTVFSRGDDGLSSHVDLTPVRLGGEVEEFFAELDSHRLESSF